MTKNGNGNTILFWILIGVFFLIIIGCGIGCGIGFGCRKNGERFKKKSKKCSSKNDCPNGAYCSPPTKQHPDKECICYNSSYSVANKSEGGTCDKCPHKDNWGCNEIISQKSYCPVKKKGDTDPFQDTVGCCPGYTPYGCTKQHYQGGGSEILYHFCSCKKTPAADWYPLPVPS